MMATAGCSDEQKREYALPKALCGVSVPEKALSELLPSGERLTADESTPVADAITTCKVTVDGDMVLSIERESREPGASARDIAVDQLSVKQPKSTAQRSVAYADWAAVSIVKCRGQSSTDEDISVAIKVLEPGHRSEAAMKELILGYTSSFQKQQPCAA
jgi:hypothetical protein